MTGCPGPKVRILHGPPNFEEHMTPKVYYQLFTEDDVFLGEVPEEIHQEYMTLLMTKGFLNAEKPTIKMNTISYEAANDPIK